MSLYGSIQNHDPVGAGGGRWVSKGRRRPRLPSGHVSRPTSRRRPSADDRTHAPRIVPGRAPDAASTPLFSRQPKSHDFRIDRSLASAPPRFPRGKRRRPLIGHRPCDISAGLSSPQILFSPHRARPQDHARGSGAGDLRVHRSTPTSRPRFRYAPLGARRGLPSAANQAGRVKTSPLRFFSSGLGRIGR